MHLVQHRVSQQDNHMLCQEYTTKEMLEALFQMNPSKALSLDGMTPAFFQSYWDILGSEVCRACLDFFNGVDLSIDLNYTNIVLIPKTPTPDCVGDLCHINSCNGFHALNNNKGVGKSFEKKKIWIKLCNEIKIP